MKTGERTFLQSASAWEVSAVLGGLFAILIAIFISVASIARFNQLASTRCWNAVGSELSDGFSVVRLSTGSGVGGHGFIDYHEEYTIPLSEGVITAIQINGPLVAGIGTLDSTPVALTLCGGSSAVSCTDRETETCLSLSLPTGCGKITGRAREFAPTDTYKGRISDLAKDLEQNSQHFFITVHTSITPTGLQRALTGSLCFL